MPTYHCKPCSWPSGAANQKPKTKVHVHSDQGSQFTGYEGQEFLEQHNLVPSMSRRGNCWDNAVVESFFNLLKRERIRRKKYKTREEARRDVFALRRLHAIACRPMDYIEFFYNPQRKHVRNGMLSPIAFEQQQKLKLQGV
jgi:putative transposase